MSPDENLPFLIEQFAAFRGELSWIEFKENHCEPKRIGEILSGLANSACLERQPCGYLIFGINNATHEISGTTFDPHRKADGQVLEHWLGERFKGSTFRIDEIDHQGRRVVVFTVKAAAGKTVSFLNVDYVRIGESTTRLSNYPDKERQIWLSETPFNFSEGTAISGISADEVRQLLHVEEIQRRWPVQVHGLMVDLFKDLRRIGFIQQQETNRYAITNIAAILFARDLNSFDLKSKAVRVIQHEGTTKQTAISDTTGTYGYAIALDLLLQFIMDKLPGTKENYSSGTRKKTTAFPSVAIREFLVNALIHQDFTISGTRSTVEIYDNRIEIVSPGQPIIPVERFIDNNRSRNERLADAAFLFGMCEQRGSGVDRALYEIADKLLPAPEIQVGIDSTTVIMFGPRSFAEMTRSDRVRACYHHCCLKHVAREKMTYQSLRVRLGLEEGKHNVVSKIIADTLEAGLIKSADPNVLSKKHMSYVPIWAPV